MTKNERLKIEAMLFPNVKEPDIQQDKAIAELHDKLTGLNPEIKVRAADIQHYYFLYLEDDGCGTLLNQCRRNDAGNIEVRTVNRTMHTETEKERTPEEFDLWREKLERM